MLDPRSKAMLELRFVRSRERSALELRRRESDGLSSYPTAAGFAGAVQAPGRTLRFAGEGGDGSVRLVRGGARVQVAAEGPGGTVSGALTLRGARPGPAALGARFGRGRHNLPIVRHAGVSWSMPIARSTVRGTLTIDGAPQRLDGWLATYEHEWGQLPLEDYSWDLFDTWAVHDRGTTWVGFTANRTDLVTGPGAREAMAFTALARVRRSGTRVCRPRIERRGWASVGSGLLSPAYAGRLVARCGRMRASFADDPRQTLIDEFPEWYEASGPAEAGGRGEGWVLHRGH